MPSPSDQRLTERRFASGFVFRNPPADMPWKHSDFPARDGDAREFAQATARLGLAARLDVVVPRARSRPR